VVVVGGRGGGSGVGRMGYRLGSVGEVGLLAAIGGCGCGVYGWMWMVL
jgi:hypothetical protein